MNLSDFVHIVFDWLQILSGECSYYKCCILNIPMNFHFDLAQYWRIVIHLLADKIKSTSRFLVKCLGMEITGIEPVTSCMPCKRSPS